MAYHFNSLKENGATIFSMSFACKAQVQKSFSTFDSKKCTYPFCRFRNMGLRFISYSKFQISWYLRKKHDIPTKIPSLKESSSFDIAKISSQKCPLPTRNLLITYSFPIATWKYPPNSIAIWKILKTNHVWKVILFVEHWKPLNSLNQSYSLWTHR